MNAEVDLKEHVATYDKREMLGSVVERIIFRNPRSSVFYMNFLAFDRNLVVTGDAYDAVYEVGQCQNMKFWSQCDACYVSGKLCGIDSKGKSTVWDSKTAKEELEIIKKGLRKEVVERHEEAFRKSCDEYSDEAFEAYCKKRDSSILLDESASDHRYPLAQWIYWHEYEPEEHVETEYHWHTFLERFGTDVFGDTDLPYEIGNIRNPFIDFHIQGLKMAVAFLEKQGEKL